jgi:hypothetical protein
MSKEEVRKYLALRHSESVYGIGADPRFQRPGHRGRQLSRKPLGGSD